MGRMTVAHLTAALFGLYASLAVVLLLCWPRHLNRCRGWSARGTSLRKRALLVIAHPDDESMFFLPSLLSMKDQGWSLSILCLSTGNADGLGNQRQKEMTNCCSFLGVSRKNLHIVDDPLLQDGMGADWPVERVAHHLAGFVNDNGPPDMILTFDGRGVSGHPNHIATYEGCRRFLSLPQPHIPAMASSRRTVRPPEQSASTISLQKPRQMRTSSLYCLETTNILRKYVGILDFPFSLVTMIIPRLTRTTSNGDISDLDGISTTIVTVNRRPWVVYESMSLHTSQFVWYRRLFVVFSRYAYMNTLRRVAHPQGLTDLAYRSRAPSDTSQ